MARASPGCGGSVGVDRSLGLSGTGRVAVGSCRGPSPHPELPHSPSAPGNAARSRSRERLQREEPDLEICSLGAALLPWRWVQLTAQASFPASEGPAALASARWPGCGASCPACALHEGQPLCCVPPRPLPPVGCLTRMAGVPSPLSLSPRSCGHICAASHSSRIECLPSRAGETGVGV